MLVLLLLAPAVAARAHGVWTDPEMISPGTIAGIVIGAIGAVLLVIAAAFAFIYIRRRGVPCACTRRTYRVDKEASADPESVAGLRAPPAMAPMATTTSLPTIKAEAAPKSPAGDELAPPPPIGGRRHKQPPRGPFMAQANFSADGDERMLWN